MSISFKLFLSESAKATSKYNVARANKEDISSALKIIADAIHIDVKTLRDNLLGSTRLTLLGKKEDSGDIDIALPHSDMETYHEKMMELCNNEGTLNKGTKVGSYALPVNGKKVQVDFMFSADPEWAKFSYHSSLNDGSKYSGAVRNIIMLTALAHTQVPGEDFVLRNNGAVVARASKSIKLDSGMERLFKMAKFNAKTGTYNKTLDTVSPDELEQHLKVQGHNIAFSKKKDLTLDPNKAVKFIFGPTATTEQVKTAEGVIKLIKKLKNSEEILAAAKSELVRLKLQVPTEL